MLSARGLLGCLVQLPWFCELASDFLKEDRLSNCTQPTTGWSGTVSKATLANSVIVSLLVLFFGKLFLPSDLI